VYFPDSLIKLVVCLFCYIEVKENIYIVTEKKYINGLRLYDTIVL